MGAFHVRVSGHQEKRQDFYTLALYGKLDVPGFGVRPVLTIHQNIKYNVFSTCRKYVESARPLEMRIVVIQDAPKRAELVYFRLSDFTDFTAHFSSLERF